MNGPAHYREAEQILAAAKDADSDARLEDVAMLLKFADLHATLALAAATAMTSHGAINYGDEPEILAWLEVAGTKHESGQCACDHHGDHAGCGRDCECAR